MELNILLPVFMRDFNAILVYKEQESPTLLEAAFYADVALRELFWLPPGHNFLSLNYSDLLAFITLNCKDITVLQNVVRYANRVGKRKANIDFHNHIILKTMGKLNRDRTDFKIMKVGPVKQVIKKGKLMTVIDLEFGTKTHRWVANYMLNQKPYDYARFFVLKRYGQKYTPISLNQLTNFLKKHLSLSSTKRKVL